MPKLNGLELREKIHSNEDVRMKCISYLFFTTAASQKTVIDAHSKSVQGFFVKPSNIAGPEKTLRNIIEYWKTCESLHYVK